ncbi:hypothetical protein [Actinoplanes couchii]|uniref:SWIM-type domain-containing protein n=1 Tax=Actinoplanes couchii TaxID=403638 RepID=A0ABQ3X416_9ACTN|nr:hypothetical protein [Actinoplanes couchii]MDR6326397.1 hypothetical protein [Actinoplanes couchii]GID53251.1 hypothetical protein Aco03nite_016550 [Actinoplanes couchii]
MSLPVRPDLLALDDGALAALANRGLVKRAAREVERDAPKLSAEENTVVADWADGVRTALPGGGLDRGTCSCGASGVCRHLIGLILAYQREPAAESAPAATEAAATDAASGEAAGAAAGETSAEAVAGKTAVGAVAGNTSAGAVAGKTAAGGVAGKTATEGATETTSAESAPAGPTAAESGRAGPAGAGSWSPGAFTDADLIERIGSRLVDAARRAERGGYTARIRRGPVPVAELPAATVRFLVPNDLGYVHTDAKAGVRDDVIALAVWAFRAADEQQPDAGDLVVDVGGSRAVAAGSGSGLESVVEFAAEVLRAGAVHAGAGLAAMATGQITALEKNGLRWPLDAATELAGQLAAYRDRGARYSPELLADLIAELFARHRAVTAGGGVSVRSRVLGSEEAAETPLRRVRLDGLGARVTAIDDERRVEIFHGQAASGVVLVSHRQWPGPDDGPALSKRRLAGATVAALAAGTLVTESAVRSASRSVRLTASRVAKSTVTVSSGAWEHLPPGLRVGDYAKLAAELDAMPPRPVRARVRADLVRVLEIAEVGGSHYEPGAQRLTVEIRDTHGNQATVTATHTSVAPARLDAVAAALLGARGRPRFVAGTVHRSGGSLVIDPYAIAADGPPVVPDLESPDTFPAMSLPGGPDLPPFLAPHAESVPAPAGKGDPEASPVPAGEGDAGVNPVPAGDGGPAANPGPATVDGPEAVADLAAGEVPEDGSVPATGDAPEDGSVPAAGDGTSVGDAVGAGLGAAAGVGSAGGGVVPVDDETTDVLAAVVASAREALAEAAHSGLAHLPPGYAARLDTARGSLNRVGLHRVASAFDELSARLSPDPGMETAHAWADAYLRVSLAADLL